MKHLLCAAFTIIGMLIGEAIHGTFKFDLDNVIVFVIAYTLNYYIWWKDWRNA